MAGVAEGLRLQLNERRLLLIDETIREDVRGVLASMQHYGWRPIIAADVWRSPARQLQLFRQGRTKVTWGFHCASRRSSDNAPVGSGVLSGVKAASLAADIVDANLRNGWDAPREFWLRLGYCAEMRGLGWGGYFGLSHDLTQGLRRHVRDREALEGPAPARLKLGWDPAHIETSRVTLAQARRGLR